MTFLLILLIIFILWPIVKLVWRFNQARSQAQKMYDQFYRQQQSQTDDYQQSGESETRRKRFDSSMGEYVDYEEIQDDSSSSQQSTQPSQPSDETPRHSRFDEPQVSDAEWEDIP
jgi:FtsZ-interacting cell division protein ZipA